MSIKSLCILSVSIEPRAKNFLNIISDIFLFEPSKTDYDLISYLVYYFAGLLLGELISEVDSTGLS